MDDRSSTWVPVTDTGDQDEVVGIWLLPGLVLAVNSHLAMVNQEMEDISLLLCLSNK